jgi:hypothetical protein
VVLHQKSKVIYDLGRGLVMEVWAYGSEELARAFECICAVRPWKELFPDYRDYKPYKRPYCTAQNVTNVQYKAELY